jgi:hypothetical protein
VIENDPLARGRARVERHADGLRIVIPAKRVWLLLAFLMLWISFWTFGAALAAVDLVNGGDDAGGVIFLILWLAGAALAGGVVVLVLGWNLFGREIVTVGGGELVVERRAGPYHSEKRFARDRIGRLRSDPKGSESQWDIWGLTGGSIELDYGNRTHRFAGKLDEAESAQLCELIAAELGSDCL